MSNDQKLESVTTTQSPLEQWEKGLLIDIRDRINNPGLLAGMATIDKIGQMQTDLKNLLDILDRYLVTK